MAPPSNLMKGELKVDVTIAMWICPPSWTHESHEGRIERRVDQVCLNDLFDILNLMKGELKGGTPTASTAPSGRRIS